MVDELEQDFVEEQVNLPRIETPTIAQDLESPQKAIAMLIKEDSHTSQSQEISQMDDQSQKLEVPVDKDFFSPSSIAISVHPPIDKIVVSQSADIVQSENQMPFSLSDKYIVKESVEIANHDADPVSLALMVDEPVEEQEEKCQFVDSSLVPNDVTFAQKQLAYDQLRMPQAALNHSEQA